MHVIKAQGRARAGGIPAMGSNLYPAASIKAEMKYAFFAVMYLQKFGEENMIPCHFKNRRLTNSQKVPFIWKITIL